MPPELLLFATLILTTRMVYLTRESAFGPRGNAVLAAVQALAVLLCFRFGAGTLAALGGIALAGGLNAALEGRVDLRAGFRLVTLAILLVVPLIPHALGTGLELRAWLPRSADLLLASGEGGIPLVAWQPPLLVLFGLLLLANEANIVVRAVFHHCRLEPRQDAQAEVGEAGSGAAEIIDKDEYNAGRVIGFLERWLMFLLIVQTNDFNALAFIIAAKGLARMKQLEDRQFAEYMLIGTFLSALCAIVVALFVRRGLAA